MDVRKRLTISLVILVLVFLTGMAGYRLFGYDYSDSAYMAVQTIARLGARDVSHDPWQQVWSIVVVTVGVVAAAFAFSTLIALMTGGELRKIFGRQKLENKVKSMRGHYIVCGCGRMGGLICDDLHEAGVPFVAVDVSEQRTAGLEEKDYLYILGDASDDKTLARAGIHHAKGLVAALGNDAENVYTTLTARELNSNLMIVSRAESQATENKLIMAGANRVVCPHQIGAVRITNLLIRPAIVEFADLAAKGLELEIDELALTEDSPFTGKMLKDSQLRERAGAIVVAIKRADGTAIYSPTADTVLEVGDSLITIGQRGAVVASKLV